MKKKASAEAMWTLSPDMPNLVVTSTQKKRGQLRFMKYKDTNKILGFVVVSGRGGAPVVRPIYEATLHLQPAGGKDASTRYMFNTYEVGERLSGYSYVEDPEGVTLASVAATALGFLQQRSPDAKKLQEAWRDRNIAAFNALLDKAGVPKDKPPKKKKARAPRR